MKNKGFALVSVLVLSTVLLIMGMGAMYMSEMGFRSLSAEQRWHILEKAANAGINEVANRIARGENCDINENLGFDVATVQVRTVRAGSGCFIWSRAILGDSMVVKTAVITIRPPTDALGAANYVQLNHIYLHQMRGEGTVYLASCDPECPVPALAMGNAFNKPLPPEWFRCPGGSSGVPVDPYIPNAFGQNENLTSRVFEGANNRDELLTLLADRFGVRFLNVGINQPNDGKPYIDVPSNCEFGAYNNCSTSSNNTISCSGSPDNPQIIITWSNGVYNITDANNQPIAQCPNVKLPNATINFNSPFTGGGIIQGGIIHLRSELQGPTLVANVVKLHDGANITNVNAFAVGINLTARNSTWSGGILYAGGGTIPGWGCHTAPLPEPDPDWLMLHGCLLVRPGSNTTIGTQNNPVLLISDNNMLLSRVYEGSAPEILGPVQINGLAFVTERAETFVTRATGYGDIYSGRGSFYFNGMIVSNARRERVLGDHKLDITLVSTLGVTNEVMFDRHVLNRLADRYDFLKRPVCRDVSINIPFIQTKTTIY